MRDFWCFSGNFFQVGINIRPAKHKDGWDGKGEGGWWGGDGEGGG